MQCHCRSNFVLHHSCTTDFSDGRDSEPSSDTLEGQSVSGTRKFRQIDTPEACYVSETAECFGLFPKQSGVFVQNGRVLREFPEADRGFRLRWQV